MSELEIGQEFKNYKELCKYYNLEVKTGEAKTKQLEELYLKENIKKVGIKFIVTSHNFTEKELIEKYGTKDIKAAYEKNGKLTAGQINKFRDRLYSFMDYEIINGEYIIKEIYKNPLPTNIAKMKKGMYQYIVPLILQKVINASEPMVTLTLHNWANIIDMINSNYDVMNYNREMFSNNSTSINLKEENINDYFDRVNNAIKYYIHNSIEMMDKTKVITYQYVTYVKTNRNQLNVVKLEKDIIINDNDSTIIRRATEEEIQKGLLMEQAAMRKAGINSIGECYYGKKAVLYKEEYDKLLEKYNEGKDEKIIKYYRAYEIFAPNKGLCKELLSNFDTKDLIKKFNKEFMEKVSGNANSRNIKDEEKYNEQYIKDYTKLLEITIPNKAVDITNKKRVAKALEKKDNTSNKTVHYIYTKNKNEAKK